MRKFKLNFKVDFNKTPKERKGEEEDLMTRDDVCDRTHH